MVKKAFVVMIGFWCLLAILSPSVAQSPSLQGQVLISVLEIGAPDNPNKLFLADARAGRITELLVQNESFFAPWVGWSPNGQQFAYLAPARRGDFFELWLANANINNPNPQPPLFDLGLNATAADWHPSLNILAVGTGGTNRLNGVYLVNAGFGNIVFVNEDVIPRNSLMDWTNDGNLIAYGSTDNQIKVVNTQTESSATIAPFVPLQARILPNSISGWMPGDQFYVFTDVGLQNVYAVDTRTRAQITLGEAFQDPFRVNRLPDGNQLVSMYQGEIYIFDLASDSVRRIQPDTPFELTDVYGLTDQNTLIVNGFIQIGEAAYGECIEVDLQDGSTRLIREVYNNTTWTHTFCQVQPGRAHIAMMTTDDLTPYDDLSPDLRYDLYILPSDLQGATFLTDNYAGFAPAPLGFSPRWAQVIFREGDDLVVYGLNGGKLTLAPLRDLGIESDVVSFEFDWQP